MQRIIFGISAFVVFAVTAMSPSAGMAQEKRAEAVVVTAGRIEQQITDAIPHTTVITQKEIRESQATDVLQLLKREAGFEFVQNGGVGTASQVFMRGGGKESTLVLIDGVRVSSATTGTTAVDQIMLSQVDRVEIVRGNVSALYGANAVGGVIQIFTKRGLGEPRGEVQATFGEHGTRAGSAFYGGQSGDVRYSVNLSKFATNGFSAMDPKSFPTRINPNANPYNNQSVSAQLSRLLGSEHEFGIRVYQSEGDVSYDGVASTDRPTTLHTGERSVGNYAVFANNRFNSVWGSKLALSQSQDKSRDRTDNATKTVAPTKFETGIAQLQWQNDFAVAPGHVVSLNFDEQRQRINSTTVYAYDRRDISSAGLGYVGTFGGHHVQMATRSDKYSDFGGANTWLGGYAYELTSDWRLTAMRSSAFRAPTLNELFFPNFGNASVKPETSQSNEAGVQYAAGGHLFRLVQFSTTYVNLIEAPGPLFLTSNVGQAKVDGTESSYAGQYANWDFRVSATLQNPINSATDAQLNRRSKKFGNFVASTNLMGWRVGGEIMASDKRIDTSVTPTAELGAYKTVNLTARRDLTKQVYVGARLENVFDERYQTAFRFNQPSRGLFMTVGWRQ